MDTVLTLDSTKHMSQLKTTIEALKVENDKKKQEEVDRILQEEQMKKYEQAKIDQKRAQQKKKAA